MWFGGFTNIGETGEHSSFIHVPNREQRAVADGCENLSRNR